MANHRFFEVLFNNEVISNREIFKERNDSLFKGKLFCPECRKAKILILGSKKNKYLTDPSTSIHEPSCSYNYKLANDKEMKLIYHNGEEYKVDKLIKEVLKKRVENKVAVGNIVIHFQDKKGNKQKLACPLIHVEDIEKKHMQVPNFIYGIANTEVKNSEKGHVINFSAIKSKFQYFNINASKVAYQFFPKSVVNTFEKSLLPIEFIYFGIFSEDKRGWRTSILKNTNYLIISKISPKI